MLEGVKIIEIEGIGPGPFAAMTLADLGAEVTVVHRKGGKTTPGMTDHPLVVDRGKRSIALDLKCAADLDVVKALISQSDALIEGFRPGVMERLGLGPDDAHALKPSLVYGRVTGWGQAGPRAPQAGTTSTTCRFPARCTMPRRRASRPRRRRRCSATSVEARCIW